MLMIRAFHDPLDLQLIHDNVRIHFGMGLGYLTVGENEHVVIDTARSQSSRLVRSGRAR